MTTADPGHDHQHSSGGPGRWVFWGFVAVAAFFLIAEHRAHVVTYLPFLLLAACPLMHLFHRHGDHGGHHRGEHENEKEKKP